MTDVTTDVCVRDNLLNQMKVSMDCLAIWADAKAHDVILQVSGLCSAECDEDIQQLLKRVLLISR